MSIMLIFRLGKSFPALCYDRNGLLTASGVWNEVTARTIVCIIVAYVYNILGVGGTVIGYLFMDHLAFSVGASPGRLDMQHQILGRGIN
jgi:hypothetical protein